jgi:CheY-like chemotaxis protein
MVKRRLLVIDDEEDFGEFVRACADALGFAVRVTTKAQEFRDAVETLDPDVIVLDLIMPDVDGIDLINWLADQGCTAKVIVTTGYDARYADNASSLATAKGLLVVGILLKPVRLAELREVLEASLAPVAKIA